MTSHVSDSDVTGEVKATQITGNFAVYSILCPDDRQIGLTDLQHWPFWVESICSFLSHGQQCGQCFIPLHLKNLPPAESKICLCFHSKNVYLTMTICLLFTTYQSAHSSCANLCILGNHDCLTVDKKLELCRGYRICSQGRNNPIHKQQMNQG